VEGRCYPGCTTQRSHTSPEEEPSLEARTAAESALLGDKELEASLKSSSSVFHTTLCSRRSMSSRRERRCVDLSVGTEDLVPSTGSHRFEKCDKITRVIDETSEKESRGTGSVEPKPDRDVLLEQ
jgi:hypothetical protein